MRGEAIGNDDLGEEAYKNASSEETILVLPRFLLSQAGTLSKRDITDDLFQKRYVFSI
jgi:hypothetical protein